MCAALGHVGVDPISQLLIEGLKLLSTRSPLAGGHVHPSQQHMAQDPKSAALHFEPERLQVITFRQQRLHKIHQAVVDEHSHPLALEARLPDVGCKDGVLGELAAKPTHYVLASRPRFKQHCYVTGRFRQPPLLTLMRPKDASCDGPGFGQGVTLRSGDAVTVIDYQAQSAPIWVGVYGRQAESLGDGSTGSLG